MFTAQNPVSKDLPAIKSFKINLVIILQALRVKDLTTVEIDADF